MFNMETIVSNENPETTTIVADLLEKLSAEAKFVMYAIFNAPGELSNFLFHDVVTENTQPIKWMTNGKMSRKRIYRYMKLLGWETRDINKTIFAIKEFARELERIGDGR